MLKHLVLCERDDEFFCKEELQATFPNADLQQAAPALFQITLKEDALQTGIPPLAFCRQLLPNAQFHSLASIKNWADLLCSEIPKHFTEKQPWQLHVAPHFGAEQAGANRCRLIRESFVAAMKTRHRFLLRDLQEPPLSWTANHSLAQLLLTSPDTGYLSLAVAPQPYTQRAHILCFEKGEIPIASDKQAPSRAFAKLVESEMRLGRRIAAGETCVDLGASPGSWSYVAIHRGAKVTAVDRSPLRADLMNHPRLFFHKGDAFKFKPTTPVDWLLCDVIAAPDRSIDLALDWARERLARQFIVTIKFKGASEYHKLDRLKKEMPSLCREFHIARLCANKNEACVFGNFLT